MSYSTRAKRYSPATPHQGSVLNESISCLHFDYEALCKATDNFNPRSVANGGCKLGEGGFGPVFRGDLHYTDVAIKVLRRTRPGDKSASDLANEQFEAELQILSRFRHPNVVTLLGYSNTSGKPRCLIYEYMVNGTLEDALDFGVERTQEGTIGLPWMVRLSIALDTARGLTYLHNAIKGTPLVHRDVKSANVLLDLSFRAKVGDFGLVRAIGDDTRANIKQSHTARIVGTSGYIAPEYYRGVITTKLDTFAFGVLLLEILTGLPSYDSTRPQDQTDLVTHIEKKIRSDNDFTVFVLCDKRAGAWPSVSFVRLFDISQKCLTLSEADRPLMKDIYILLDDLVKSSSKLYAEEETKRLLDIAGKEKKKLTGKVTKTTKT